MESSPIPESRNEGASAGGGWQIAGSDADEHEQHAAAADPAANADVLGAAAFVDPLDRATADPLTLQFSPPSHTAGSGTSPASAAAASGPGGGASTTPSIATGSSGSIAGAPPVAAAHGASGSTGPAVNWQLLIAATGLPQDDAGTHAPAPRAHPLSQGHTAAAAPLATAATPVSPTSGGPTPPRLMTGGSGNPTAINQTAITKEDTAVNIYWLTYGDTDRNADTLTLQSITQPTNGTAGLNSDGTVTYTPSLHYSGSDSFTYTITNGNGGTATANVAVTMQPVHYPPTVDNVSVSTNENTPVAITLSGSSIENLPLTYAIDSDPGNGTFGDLNGNTITYYPGGNFTGTDTFTYVANDGDVTGASGTVTITVNSVTLSPGVTITPAGGSMQIAEQGTVSDDGETTGESGTYTVVLNTQPLDDVTVAVNAPGELAVDQPTLTFTAADWFTPQTVTVTAPDNSIAEGDHTVTIAHSASSTDPSYNGITIASLPVAITDSDTASFGVGSGSNPGDLNEVGPTSSGFPISLTSQPVDDVTVTLTPDSFESVSPSSLTFTPSDWNTPQTVTVTAVHDGIAEGYHTGTITLSAASADTGYSGLSSSFSVNILDADGPNALPVSAETSENSPTTFDVLSNDSDPSGYPLTVSSVTQPADGTVVINADNTLTYAPNTNLYGDDSFSYTISNGQGGTASGSIDVNTDFVDQPPGVTNPGDQTSPTDTAVSLQIQASNPNDPSNTDFLFTATGLPPGLVIDPMTGNIWGWIDPTAWQQGSYDAEATVDDLNGGVTSVDFTWDVTEKNHPPVALGWGDQAINAGTYVQQQVVTGLDVDGDALTYSISGLPPGLSLGSPQPDWVSGTPTTVGTYTVTATVTDSNGASASTTFLWTVLDPNAPQPASAAIHITDSQGNLQDSWPTPLVSPATPVYAAVDLGDPTHPDQVHTVTLAITPSGRSSLSQSSFSLSDGQSARFIITPQAVSQTLSDVELHVYVDGAETHLYYFTNLGVVLPQNDITGEDTTDGMPDRVSVGAGSQGTFYGTMQVYPNLYGMDDVSLSMQSPNNSDTEYGVATADDPELSVMNTSVVAVYGTTETDLWGDNGAAYAEQLQLVAQAGAGRVADDKKTEALSIIKVPVQALIMPGANDTFDSDLKKTNEIFSKAFIKFLAEPKITKPDTKGIFFINPAPYATTLNWDTKPTVPFTNKYNKPNVTYLLYFKGLAVEEDKNQYMFEDGQCGWGGVSNYVLIGTTEYTVGGRKVTHPGPLILAHELGHSRGLGHPGHGPGDLMFADSKNIGPNLTQDDIKKARAGK